MSDLSNLYISESFFGIINLEDSELPLVSQSGDINFQDGIGDNIGLKINAQTKKFTIVNDLQVDGNADFNGDIDISGSFTHTGSIDVVGDVTIVGNLTAHTGSFDTINTRILHVTLESSSIIFSSGSNVLGDEITDTQTLVGQVSISGSLSVDGNSTITGSLNVSNEISSSTINGIGNVTLYSQSVDLRLTNLELDSASQDQRLDSLELYTASQDVINSGYNLVTASYYQSSASFDTRIDALEQFSSSLVADFVTDVEYSASIAVVTASLESQINTKLNSSWTGSVFSPFSSSVDTRINSKLDTSIFTSFSSSIQSELDLKSDLVGNNIFSGSNTFSGSVNGVVSSLTISSQTASMDCSKGNFFTIQLVSGSITRLEASNIKAGQTISFKVKQPSVGFGDLDFDTSFKFPTNNSYVPTFVASSEDIVSFVTYNSSSLYGVAVYNLV